MLLLTFAFEDLFLKIFVLLRVRFCALTDTTIGLSSVESAHCLINTELNELSSSVFAVDLNLILSVPGDMIILLQITAVICYRRTLQKGHN